MITSVCKWLEPELMDVVRLFEGAETLEIAHEVNPEGGCFENKFQAGDRTFCRTDPVNAHSDLEYKSLMKRYAKLSLYRFLSDYYHKTLPWGSLTGIRPTRLAYAEQDAGRDFRALFEEMGVSKENIGLVARVLKGQEGIYERREGNCDLFVSLPFCPTKCTYCSFITAPIERTRGFVPAYLEAIERELEGTMSAIGRLRSVYIGGGTPFVLEAEDLARVLGAVDRVRGNGCELTVEAGRPDVFTEAKLEVCKRYGVTRICINAQSFSDRTLAAIGRKHSAEDVYRAFSMAKPYGFDVNCDLIAGLTGESVEEFKRSIDAALSLSPENITVHTLCLKKGAKLKEETQTLSEGGMSEMIAYSREKLTAAGYEPYYLYRQKYMAGAHENVGWTKPGKACVYNVDVMEETADNLAVGSNAISKRVILKEGRIERIGSSKDIPTYLAKVGALIEEKKRLFSV